MSLTTPAMGTPVVSGERAWFRFVRRLATRATTELSLVYVPDGTHDRLVVLKRLLPALATDPAAVEKFRVEARIAALLEHPNIVRVLELVETPAEDFYTMEYIRGCNVRQLMDVLVAQKRTLPLDCVLLIAIELCSALDYAHHLCDPTGAPAPVVHRELSPSKVMLGIDGSIKLTGFGPPPLARGMKLRRSRTESVGYSPPEQCLGETLDSRSDVFALGVLLYELSSGQQLFGDAANEHQIMMRIVRGDLPRPSEVRRGYPRELEQILMRAIARDPHARFQNAADLMSELQSFLWSRWPTASTNALAKLVTTAFPDQDDDVRTRELERIDPFKQTAVPPSEDPVLWLGPVPLAKPYPRVGEPGRPDTNELRRLAPKKLGEGSNTKLTLGAAGTRPPSRPRSELDRATTVDELAIPIEYEALSEDPIAPREKGGATQPVQLGTPGAKPAPRRPAVEKTRSSEASLRGQYQRPEALDEHAPHGEHTPGTLARLEPAKIATPVSLERADHGPRHVDSIPGELDHHDSTSNTVLRVPSPLEIARQRLPSPRPSQLATRRWPIATIAAIAGVVVVGVLLSAWAIRHTVHEPSQLPEVLAAQPAPPSDLVVRTSSKAAVTMPAPASEPKKSARKSSSRRPAAASVEPEPKKKIPPLFPPSDPIATTLPGAAPSFDGLPSITAIEVRGAVPEPAIRKAVEPTLSSLRACYRVAARTSQVNPAVKLSIVFEVDHRKQPVKVRAVGGGALASLATCAAKVTSELRDLPAPDGRARVTVSIDFQPNP